MEPLSKKPLYSREEYLLMESAAAHKSEYHQGEIFAMTGGSPRHSMINLNINWCIREAVRHNDCVGFESNMKLDIPKADAYLYPDAMVICGGVRLSEGTTDAVTNPVLVVEVLSPTTETFDRGRKFDLYRAVASLKEYVLVSQDKPKVEVFSRQSTTLWQYAVAEGLDKTVYLESLAYEVKLSEVYAKIDFGVAGSPS